MSHRSPVPNAQAQAYLDACPAVPPVWARSVEEVRIEMLERSLANAGELEPVSSVDEVDADGVHARLYRSTGNESEVLVWLHGGGWIIGNPDCYDAVSRTISNRAKCAVLSVDYRLAPEYRFPAAIEDSWAATTWGAERYEQIAVGGDSAGGNLAAAVALRARDTGLELALQLLVYPVTAYAPDSPFYEVFRDRYEHFAGKEGYGAAREQGHQWLWEQYVPDPFDRAKPDASPMRALSLKGLAPTFMITAEHDILRGENEDFARALEAAGVPVKVLNYEGQIHGFYHMPGFFDDAHHAIIASATALREAFTAQGSRSASAN